MPARVQAKPSDVVRTRFQRSFQVQAEVQAVLYRRRVAVAPGVAGESRNEALLAATQAQQRAFAEHIAAALVAQQGIAAGIGVALIIHLAAVAPEAEGRLGVALELVVVGFGQPADLADRETAVTLGEADRGALGPRRIVGDAVEHRAHGIHGLGDVPFRAQAEGRVVEDRRAARQGQVGRGAVLRPDEDPRRVHGEELAVDRVQAGQHGQPIVEQALLKPGLEQARGGRRADFDVADAHLRADEARVGPPAAVAQYIDHGAAAAPADGLFQVHFQLEVEMCDVATAIADATPIAQRIDARQALEQDAALRRATRAPPQSAVSVSSAKFGTCIVGNDGRWRQQDRRGGDQAWMQWESFRGNNAPYCRQHWAWAGNQSWRGRWPIG
jgi:hypothetical protein